MTKTELISQISTKTGQPTKVVAAVVEAVFDGITDAVAGGDTAAFVGFGSFTSAARAARTGRNPQTGDPIHLHARAVPKFAPGSVFKAKVRNGR